MFGNLQIFQMASALASHAGTRQTLIAQNIANADTPGYKSQDLKSFRETFERPQPGVQKSDIFTPSGSTSPNGNSVSLEEEMVKAGQVKRDHDQALAIYRSSLTILRAAIGRR
ncbi:MAG: FlgB family protein [Thalassovita sp.]